MADVTMKQNDTRQPLVRNLRQTVDGVAGVIALTTASKVDLHFRPANAAYKVSGTCLIASAAGGVVQHNWIVTETATVGLFDAEFEITWNDGGVETVPNDGYFSIEFVDDIGP